MTVRCPKPRLEGKDLNVPTHVAATPSDPKAKDLNPTP